MAKQHKFYAAVLPGLEELAAKELAALSAHDIEVEYGGINFTGTMQLLYRVNLRARTITRVLMRLRTFRSMTLEGLRYDLEKVAWHLFLDENSTLDVMVHSRHSRLNHSDDIADFAKETIKKLLPKLGTSESSKHTQTLHIRIDNNRGALSLDTSGERLDRRGYRLESGKAPLRETLAAAMLQWVEWQPEQHLLAPMCGSGTFAIEAALMATQTAPNLHHDFSFLHYPSLKEKDWLKTLERCKDMKKDASPQIFASDYNEGAIRICQENSKRANAEKLINIEQQDIHTLSKPATDKGGVLILNPPYGQRIGEQKETLSLWVDLGDIIRNQFADDELWRTVIICPDPIYEKALKLKIQRRLKVMHGGLEVMLLEV
jgi:putative N6-adenine-specific DNA methylase